MKHELISEHWPRLLAVATLLGLGTVACGNDSKEAQCISPRSVSHIYIGDQTADPEDQATWINGVRIEAHLSNKATALIVGYRDPNGGGWQDSSPIPKADSKFQAVRIGPGDVQFSASVVAKEGSSLCDEEPDAMFSKLVPYKSLIENGANAPRWP